MINNSYNTPSVRIESLSFPQIEAIIKERSSIIIPLGGYEPFGREIPINGINLCCEKIAETFALQNKILMSSIIPIGYTTPFKSFGGCCGVSKDSLRDIILDICKSWIFMGVKRILIITTGTYNIEAIKTALKIINGKNSLEQVKFFSLQHSEEVRTFCESNFEHKGYERYECGILALLLYLFPNMFIDKILQISSEVSVPEVDKLKRWYRLGKDPNKLRKLAPEGFLSDVRGKTITRELGKLLFDYIIEVLNKKYFSFLTEGIYDT